MRFQREISETSQLLGSEGPWLCRAVGVGEWGLGLGRGSQQGPPPPRSRLGEAMDLTLVLSRRLLPEAAAPRWWLVA